MIIGVVGRTVDKHNHFCSVGTGKDTVADILSSDTHDFVKIALADSMKRFCMELYGFSPYQLWGPSDERNKPDKRYPRKHTYANGKCACCGSIFYEERGYGTDECYLTPRYALQRLGTEWGRSCYEDTWVNHTLNTATEVTRVLRIGSKSYPHCSYVPQVGTIESNIAYEYGALRAEEIKGVVIPDVRFKSEVQAIKSVGGKMLLIYRKVDELPEGVDLEHQSEVDLNEYGPDDELWDDVIYNFGNVKDLEPQTKQALAVLRGTV